MVLQRDKPVRVWGWADAGEQISVSIAGQKVIGEANGQGRWSLFLDPMNAGGPYEMIVEAGNTLRVRDVLIGEVWVGSGQSNMVCPLGRSNNAEREIAEADYPKIRFFKVALRHHSAGLGRNPGTVLDQPLRARQRPGAASCLRCLGDDTSGLPSQATRI
jgi:hypothetical protein